MSLALADSAPAWQHTANKVAYSDWFQNIITAVIILNAATIGVSTYPVDAGLQHAIEIIDAVFLGIFVVELVLRMAAYGFNLKRFFSDAWNVFDFVVVAACFIPGLSSNSTALRLVRLLRVTRLIKLMPDVRVLASGLKRALGPAASLMALTVLLCYLYAVIGWIMFHDKTPPDKPQYFANIGESMLTLFELLTLEGWNSTMRDLRDLHPLALPFVISFLMIGTYIVINLVVGVVITSLDEAYKQRDRELQREALNAEGASAHATLIEVQELMQRLEMLVGREASFVTAAHDRMQSAEAWAEQESERAARAEAEAELAEARADQLSEEK